MNIRSLFVFFIFLLQFLEFARANVVTLVDSHRPVATIVVDKGASQQIQAAATKLQTYIQKSTGAKLPLSNEAGNGANIYVGESAYTRAQNVGGKGLDRDGFILEAVDNQNFAIVGGSDWGVEFGVDEFLERYMGVRWLMPTDAGTDVPLLSTLSIKETVLRQEPVYLSRELAISARGGGNPDDSWGRFNRATSRIEFHHNLLNIFPVSVFGKNRPDIYPFVNGKRYIPVGDRDYDWQPNFTAPGIVDIAAGNIEKYFQAHPDATSFSLGMNDSNNWDQSSGSKSRRSGGTNYLGYESISDDYYAWANAVVAKVLTKYPGKLFGTLAYNGNSEPPTRFGLNSQIVPFIAYERMRWSDPKLRAIGQQLNQRWSGVASSLGYYDYAYGVSYLLPRVYFHEMQQYLSWGAAHHVKYYFGELYPNWGEGPKPWVLTKLLWNPNQDVDALLDDWYVHCAGPAAAPQLRGFYSIWENFWTVSIFKSKWNSDTAGYLHFNLDPSYLADVNDSDVARAESYMSRALELADTPERKARVLKLKQMWDFYRLSIVAYKEKDLVSGGGGFLSKMVGSIVKSDAAEQRRNLLSSFAADPLFTESANFISKYPPTSGLNW